MQTEIGNVLGLFDGMSCGQIALNRAGIKFDKYHASEIDKYAIKVTMANYPDTIQLGSVTEVKAENLPKIDLLIGGSPCQGFSFAGKRLNFDDPRSKLFFEYVRLLKECKPKYFLLENVIMDKKSNDVISSILGEIYPDCVSQTEIFRSGRLEPIEINSSLLSAQNRRRLYWTNIEGVEQPKDKGILLKDIIENGEPQLLSNQGKSIKKEYVDKSHSLMARDYKGFGNQEMTGIKVTGGAFRGRNPENPSVIGKVGNQNKWKNYGDKSPTLRGLSRTNNIPKTEQRLEITETEITWRKLTPIECERLQTVDDNYTAHVSNSQRYKMLGNGWTVDVIAHIFSYIKKAVE